jgi:pyrimidine nucleoside transport protein
MLFYLGAMQWIVVKIGYLLQVSVGTTACESLNSAANIFLGQSEAPLMIKPFLKVSRAQECSFFCFASYSSMYISKTVIILMFTDFCKLQNILYTAKYLLIDFEYCTQELKYPRQKPPLLHFKNIASVTIGRNRCQSCNFQSSFIWLLAVALLFRKATVNRQCIS